MTIRSGRRRSAPGLVLMALLLSLAIGAIALAAVADVWAVTRQRQLEEELLFVGDQYRAAIERYYRAVASAPAFPASLDELLLDPRFPQPVQHLRRAYLDPITGSSDWGLVRVGDRIAGVFSRSEAPTIKRANFPAAYVEFEDREQYSQWRFVYTPRTRRGRTTTPGGPPPVTDTGTGTK
jgi:type II secretory pathway pseudopilin PulG